MNAKQRHRAYAVHLWRAAAARAVAACGRMYPASATHDARRVTCIDCKRTPDYKELLEQRKDGER